MKQIFARLTLLMGLLIAGGAQPAQGQASVHGACGLTIITHGFQPPNYSDPLAGWVFEMAKAVRARAGSTVPIYVARYVESGSIGRAGDHFTLKRYDGGSLVSVDDIAIGDYGAAILLVDWTVVSDEVSLLSTQAVAYRLFMDVLYRPHQSRFVLEVPIHLIGHSRGTSVNSALAQLLNERGILVDHVTTLDPHPVTSVGDDDDPEAWVNVLFADNYFQTGDQPKGRPIAGAVSINLDGIVRSSRLFEQHALIHNYYHGTIALHDRGTTEVLEEWYNHLPAVRTGYNYSRYGRESRPGVGLNARIVGANGWGFRRFTGWAGSQWPNVAFAQGQNPPWGVQIGEKVVVRYLHADRDSQQRITFFLDDDTNPYNGWARAFAEVHPSSRADASIGSGTVDFAPLAEDEKLSGWFIGAKTTDGVTTRVRYDYYLKTIMVYPPFEDSEPFITGLTPQNLIGKPVGVRQPLIIRGRNFTPASTLRFETGGVPIPSTAEHLEFVSPNELHYDVAVGPASADWSVRVIDGALESNAAFFSVTAAQVQLLSLTVSSPKSLNEGASAPLSAVATYSDGSTPRVDATWSVAGSAATVNGQGVLTAGSVDTDQSVTVTATFGGKSGQAVVPIMNVGGTGTEDQEFVVNGNFASGGNRWLLSGAFQADSRFSSAYSAPGYAYLAQPDGSAGNGLTGTIDQVVTIPADASAATLSYRVMITTQEDGGGIGDALTVRLMDPTGATVSRIVDLRSNLDATASYALRSFDLTAFRGETVRLSFSAATNGTKPTTFRIDDVSLRVVRSTSTPEPGTGRIEVTGGGDVIYNDSTTPGVGDNTDFGWHWMGETTALFSFRIYNRGTGVLSLTGTPSVALEGSGSFRVEAQPAPDVEPGSYRSFQIRFDPTDVGIHGATVIIRSNDPNLPEYRFAIGGEGRFRDLAAPSVALESPTTGATLATFESTLSLAGTAADNVRVTQVTWSNSRGGSGTATGTGSWTIVDAPLASGDNVFTITARDDAGNTAAATLTVTYTPTEPEITASTTSLRPTAVQGTAPANQSFTVRNSGSGTLDYVIATDSEGGWLAVSPTAGTSTGEADPVVVTYATAGLAPGTYQGTITVSAVTALNSPVSLPVTLSVSSVAPTEPYVARSVRGTGLAHTKAAAGSPDGGLLLVGDFSGGMTAGTQSLTGAGSTDIFLARNDPTGTLLWLKRLGGAGEESVDACVPYPGGGWLVAGTFTGTVPFGGSTLTSAGDRDAFIARLNAEGDVVWAQRAGGTSTDYGRQVAVDAQGNGYLVGSFMTSATFTGSPSTVTAGGTSPDGFVGKYGANGAVTWVRSFGGNQYDDVTCAGADEAGNLYIAGTFQQQAAFGPHTLTVLGLSGTDAYVTKLDATGSFAWAKRVGEPSGGFSVDSINFVAPGPDGVCFFGGSSYGPVTLDGQTLPAQTAAMGFVGKVGANGVVAWLRALPTTGTIPFSFCERGVALDDGTLAIAGRLRGQLVFGGSTLPAEASGLANNVYFAKLDASGTALWAVLASTPGSDDYLRYFATGAQGTLEALATFGGTTLTLPGASATTLIGGDLTHVVLGPPLPPAAPRIGAVADATTKEDTPTAPIPVTLADDDTLATALTLTAASSNAALIPHAGMELAGAGVNRTLRLVPASDAAGTAVITLTVSDGALSASTTFTVTVTPENDPPTGPANALPAAGTTVASLTPLLQASPYADAEEDLHGGSQWQVLDAATLAVLWDSGPDGSAGTSRMMPPGPLEYAAAYRWRVRYRDASGAWSPYSEATVFHTPAPPVPEILRPPSGVAVGQGGSVTLVVRAQPAGWLTYQWRRNGEDIPGATEAFYAIESVQDWHAGNYTVRVSTTSGTVETPAAALTVLPAGTWATHTAPAGGYVPGTRVAIAGEFQVATTASAVTWQVLLPPGWKYVGDTTEGAARPAPGTTDLLEWTWSTASPNPLRFTFSVVVPVGETSVREIVGLVGPTIDGMAVTLLAKPDPLLLRPVHRHAADTDSDFQLSLRELTRVIELYNVRTGTTRTGAYAINVDTEDGFAGDSARGAEAAPTLARYHSADTRGAAGGSDGAIDLLELTRVIELYNTREGTQRTGAYHVQPGTGDGFAAGR